MNLEIVENSTRFLPHEYRGKQDSIIKNWKFIFPKKLIPFLTWKHTINTYPYRYNMYAISHRLITRDIMVLLNTSID